MAISKLAREQMQASSWIRRMFEEGMELKAIHGAENVFDLSLGNPLLEPPPEFKQALAKLLKNLTAVNIATCQTPVSSKPGPLSQTR